MANLYGYSCGECSNVYQARAWEPTCPRCQSADTSQISAPPLCHCPIDCACRPIHRGAEGSPPCGCLGDGSTTPYTFHLCECCGANARQCPADCPCEYCAGERCERPRPSLRLVAVDGAARQ